MLDDLTVDTLIKHWSDGWNTPDLETIMAPFTPDVVFSSPFVPKLTGDPTTLTITGHDALRSYIRYALDAVPGIRYELDASFVGTETLVLVYTCHNPDGSTRPGSDCMRVNGVGLVAEWRCHYDRGPL